MTPCTRHTAVITLILCLALPAWGENYYLYTPQPVPTGQKNLSQEGILVQEVEIQKGDTLFGLSRKFSGHGMYFPQILLFNSINNPDLIYSGKSLKVPVAHKEAHNDMTDARPDRLPNKAKTTLNKKMIKQSTASLPADALPTVTHDVEIPFSDIKSSGSAKASTRRNNKKFAVHTKSTSSQNASSTTTSLQVAHKKSSLKPAVQAPPAGNTTAGQKLFETAMKAYHQDDCRTALELLDRYLLENSGSPLAADASLYKAECYLKMSAQ